VHNLGSVVCCLSFVRALVTGWELERNKQATGVEAGPLDDSRSRSAAVVAVVQRSRSRATCTPRAGVFRRGSMGPTPAAPPRPWTSPFPVGFHSSRNLEQFIHHLPRDIGVQGLPVCFLPTSFYFMDIGHPPRYSRAGIALPIET
jgi:hypothetical protein